MPTYWVSAAFGNDVNTGADYANAKATITGAAGGLSLCTLVGDVLNVVNDATHVWTTTEFVLNQPTKGASFASPGLTIRGCNSTGTTAFTTLAPSGAGFLRFIQILNDAGYVIISNLVFDDTSQRADGNPHTIVRVNDTGAAGIPGPVLFDECLFKGAALGALQPVGARGIYSSAGAFPPAGNELFQFDQCYAQNWDSLGLVSMGAGGGTLVKSFDRVVMIWDCSDASGSFHVQNLAAPNATGGLRVKNCTIYVSSGAFTMLPQVTYNVGGGGACGNVDVYNNLYFGNSTLNPAQIRFMADSSAPGGETYTGTIGFTALYGGPNVASSDLHATGWYQNTWDPDGNDGAGIDPYATDVATFDNLEADVFSAPGSAYSWVVDSGLSIPLPKDLRPRLHLTVGQGGTVPGALPAADTDLSIDIVTSNAAPDPNVLFDLTVTVANTGVDVTSLVCTCLLPTELTFVSALPSLGSYVSGTGVWTVGNLASGADETLVITAKPKTSAENQSVLVTASITSWSGVGDLNLVNNIDSVILAIGTLEKKLFGDTSNEKIIPPEASNEKILSGETSNEKVLPTGTGTEKVLIG